MADNGRNNNCRRRDFVNYNRYNRTRRPIDRRYSFSFRCIHRMFDVGHRVGQNLQEPGCGLAFDEFGDIKFEDEKARLDNFAIQLSMNEEQRGSIIVFAGRQTYENEAKERLKRAKNYLVNVRKIDPNQILTVDGGYREDFQVYFYIIPPGADPPSLEADVSHTEIQFTKRRPKVLAEKHR